MIIPNIWESKKWQPNHQPVMFIHILLNTKDYIGLGMSGGFPPQLGTSYWTRILSSGQPKALATFDGAMAGQNLAMFSKASICGAYECLWMVIVDDACWK